MDSLAAIGAGGRSRTLDLRITNALLYQLSYTGGPAVPSTLTKAAPVDGAAKLSSDWRARATSFLVSRSYCRIEELLQCDVGRGR